MKVARALGGERVPVTGRTGQRGAEVPDIEHEAWALEVKHKGTVPAWLLSAMKQAKGSVKDHHLAPVVVVHPAGARIDDSLCVLPLASLLRLQYLLGYG